MKKLIIAGLAVLLTAGVAFADINIRGGFLFNYQDGEQKPIVATTLKEFAVWKVPLTLDLWAADIDDLMNGISNDWEGGIALNYTIPLDIPNLEVSIGYGVGSRSPFNDTHEFIHGATAFGVNWKF